MFPMGIEELMFVVRSLRLGAKQLSNSDVGNGVVTLRMHRGGGSNCAAREIQPRIVDSGSTSVRLRGMVVNQVSLILVLNQKCHVFERHTSFLSAEFQLFSKAGQIC